MTPPAAPTPASDPVAALNAALAGRYVIDSELGHGGMATVYLTRDSKLERFVALKTLRPEIAVALGRERFLREIKLAARLQHPNILPVYESGDANGTLFYIMPYVEGESLRDRLEREPQLPLDDALKITLDVAAALSYAHDHDVVHRDIKPENIMLSGGRALVADFGIARAISAAGGDKLTETGLAIGTPAYMSPEQATGDKVDRRTDIYSLGCVLYETLAGQPPFTGSTAQAIMARHSLDSVPRVKIVRETIPDALDEVIRRALAKVSADRYSTAAQFAEALATASTGAVSRLPGPAPARPHARWRRLAAAAAGAGLLGVVAWMVFGPGRGARGAAAADDGLDAQRVAVLYFVDESRDSSLGYLADGLTESLIEELAQVRSLDVISRNGVARFRGAEVSRDSIARTLAAGTLVEGDVERAGARLRVVVRLVDGASGVDVARQAFELPPGKELALRDSITQQAARFLRERLGEDIRLRDQRAGTGDVDAWTQLQRAQRWRKEADSLFRSGDAAGAVHAWTRADSALRLAAAADPKWKEPIVERGWAARQRARLGPRLEAPAWIDSGLAHGARALALAPHDPKALELRGTLRYAQWLQRTVTDPAAQRRVLQDAKADLEAATAADPSLATANLTLSSLLYQVDDVPGALLRARQAYEEDAYLANVDAALDRLFWGSIDLEQLSEARRWCTTGAQRFPNDPRFVSCQLWLMVTPAVPPDVALGWALLDRLERVTPAPRRLFAKAEGLLLVGGAIARAGLADSARRVMLQGRALAAHEVDPEQTLLAREAYVRTLAGDRDEAIDLLKRYVAANPTHGFAEQAGTVWWWRGLRSYSRWREISQPGR